MDFLLTSYWLPIGFLLTAYWLSIDFLLASYWLPIGSLLTSYWLPIDFLLTSYWLPIDFLLTSYWLPIEYFLLPAAAMFPCQWRTATPYLLLHCCSCVSLDTRATWIRQCVRVRPSWGLTGVSGLWLSLMACCGYMLVFANWNTWGRKSNRHSEKLIPHLFPGGDNIRKFSTSFAHA